MRAALLLLLLVSTPALAQTAGGGAAAPSQARFRRPEAESTPSSSYHRLFEAGQATVQVSVVGAVQQPGLYEIAVGTDIGRLLALSGGPRYETRENTRRRVELRLFRPQAGTEPIYATTLQDAATNTAAYPRLCEGDTFLVDVIEKRGFGWQEIAALAGGISAVAVVVGVLLGGGGN